MNSTKYIGMDVHKEATTIAVMNVAGKLIMESIVETKAATIGQFVEGLRGELYVTFEEGTWAAWLYDLLKPHVTKVVVCNPRKNALLKTGNKSDRIDARKLAELLRAGLLSAVYHGETGLRTLKELCRSYLAISKDLARTMNRIKALYRSWSIPCGGASVYAPRHRAEWLNKITEPAFAAGPSCSISSWMGCRSYDRKHGAICWRRAASRARRTCSRGFPISVRFGPLC
jgi:transposase